MTKDKNLFDRISRANDIVLDLLSQIPNIDIATAIDFDFEAKREMMTGGYKRIDFALKNRIIAATRLSQEGEKCSTLFSAAMAYDRAGKFAEQMGLIEPALICRIRACKIFNSLGYKEDSDEMKYASDHVLKMATTYQYDEMKNGTPEPRNMGVVPYQIYAAFLGEDS